MVFPRRNLKATALILSLVAASCHGFSRSPSCCCTPSWPANQHNTGVKRTALLSKHWQSFEDDLLGSVPSLYEPYKRKGLGSRVSEAAGRYFNVDRARLSQMGIAFVLSYSIISTLNGGVSLSLAWYIASKQVSIFRTTI